MISYRRFYGYRFKILFANLIKKGEDDQPINIFSFDMDELKLTSIIYMLKVSRWEQRIDGLRLVHLHTLFMSYATDVQKLFKLSALSTDYNSLKRSQFSIPSLSPYLQKKQRSGGCRGGTTLDAFAFQISSLSNFHPKITWEDIPLTLSIGR